MKKTHWIQTSTIAHRGLHDEKHPENTLSAFQHAISHGYDVEMDIRLTKDNKLVVIHDNNLSRLCNTDKIVSNESYDSIQDLTILNTNEKIPLFENVLASLPSDTKVMIELKSGPRNKQLVKTFMDIMNMDKHNYVVLSFDPRIVYLFKKYYPAVMRGQISKKYTWFPNIFSLLLTNMCFNIFTKPEFIVYKLKDLPNKRLDKLYKKGKIVISYTARSNEELTYIRNRYDNAVFENFLP